MGDFRLATLFNEIYCHIRTSKGLPASKMPDPSELSARELKEAAARRLSLWKGYVHNAIRYSETLLAESDKAKWINLDCCNVSKRVAILLRRDEPCWQDVSVT